MQQFWNTVIFPPSLNFIYLFFFYFRKCATISAHYGMSNEFDNLTLSLCKFTMLLNPLEVKNSASFFKFDCE